MKVAKRAAVKGRCLSAAFQRVGPPERREAALASNPMTCVQRIGSIWLTGALESRRIQLARRGAESVSCLQVRIHGGIKGCFSPAGPLPQTAGMEYETSVPGMQCYATEMDLPGLRSQGPCSSAALQVVF
jgi:hypothetical protein